MDEGLDIQGRETGLRGVAFRGVGMGRGEIFGKLFGKAVMEVCVQRVGGGMDKVPIFKERKGGGGFGEFVPEAVLSSVPIPNQPTGQLHRAANEKSPNYRSNIKSSRSASHSHKTGVYELFSTATNPLLPPPSRPSTAPPHLLTLAVTP